MKDLETIIRKKICSKFFIDNGNGLEDTIFIAGTGRSGTTFLSNLINYKREYRYIFEPFYPDKVEISNNISYKQYIPPNSQNENFIEMVRKILSGKYRNKWTDHQNTTFFAKFRLIKDIRANLFLKFIKNNFPEIPIIFVMRHPCAVANSRLSLNWRNHLESYLSQKSLMEDFLDKYESDILKMKTPFEKQIMMWCIETYIPIRQFSEDELHIVFYENLCFNPKKEINSLFSFLNKDYDERIFSKLKNPSSTAREKSAIITGRSLIDNWRSTIEDSQIHRCIEILSLFGLNEVYNEHSIPIFYDTPQKILKKIN